MQVKGKILPIFMAAKGAQLWSLLHFLFTFSSYFLPSDQFHFLFFFSFFCRSLQLRKRKQNAPKMSILSKPRSKRGIFIENQFFGWLQNNWHYQLANKWEIILLFLRKLALVKSKLWKTPMQNLFLHKILPKIWLHYSASFLKRSNIISHIFASW